MDNSVRLQAVMQFLEQAQQSLVIEVMDGASKEDLVKLVRGKGTSAQVCRDEMHVRSIMKASSCCLDRNGVDIHTMVIELAKGIRDMPVCTAEIKQLAGWVEFREVKLSLESRRPQNALDEIPKRGNESNLLITGIDDFASTIINDMRIQCAH